MELQERHCIQCYSILYSVCMQKNVNKINERKQFESKLRKYEKKDKNEKATFTRVEREKTWKSKTSLTEKNACIVHVRFVICEIH